jgi:glutaredoxin
MILISGKSCGMCKMAKNLLFKKNLKYIEYDYEEAESKEYIEMAKPKTALPFLFDKNICYCGMDAIKHIKEK